MYVLITGGAGFIGTNLVARLNSLPDIEVRIFDNEALGRRERLDAFKGEFMYGDINDKEALNRALDGVDAVVHLAAQTRVTDSIADPALNFLVNVNGTFNLLEAMRARGIKRLVNASTGGATLGEVEPPVHEDMAPQPLAPYGAGKLSGEAYCSAYAGSYGLSSLSLRFSNVYGPRSFHKGSVIAAFFKQILREESLIVYGDGSAIRDFVFVDDICDGIIRSLSVGITGVIQLGSGKPVTLNSLIDEMRRVTNPRPIAVRHAPARQGEIHATWCDITKARRVLGFEPVTSLADGLAKTWKWFLDHSGSVLGRPTNQAPQWAP